MLRKTKKKEEPVEQTDVGSSGVKASEKEVKKPVSQPDKTNPLPFPSRIHKAEKESKEKEVLEVF